MPPKKATKKQVVQEEQDDLVDFEPDTEDIQDDLKTTKSGQQGYVAIHSSGFRDFLLKPELLKAVVDSGFEHPSEVQHQSIPQAILGTDVLCQAKAGMGKTAVFVLSLLQQIEPVQNQCQALVLCHTRELAFQISKEFVRFAKYLPKVVVSVFFGGISIKINEQALKSEVPNIVVGTPGRINQLIKDKTLDVSKIRHFVLDECDKLLDSLKMRKVIQEIFKATPRDKQVMMFSATLAKETRELAKKFMSENPQVICVDDETKLVLHGLLQYYIKLAEKEKNRKLAELLDNLEFNQVVIFVRTTSRARDLTKLLNDSSFPAICIHSDMDQQERIERYQSFKNFQARLLVATDVFGRGIDIERVNIVINYDMPDEADSYLHRVGRAGRFGTKGLTISFVSTDDTKESLSSKVSKRGYSRPHTEEEVLQQVQDRFAVKIEPLPEKIDVTQYMTS